MPEVLPELGYPRVLPEVGVAMNGRRCRVEVGSYGDRVPARLIDVIADRRKTRISPRGIFEDP